MKPYPRTYVLYQNQDGAYYIATLRTLQEQVGFGTGAYPALAICMAFSDEEALNVLEQSITANPSMYPDFTKDKLVEIVNIWRERRAEMIRLKELHEKQQKEAWEKTLQERKEKNRLAKEKRQATIAKRERDKQELEQLRQQIRSSSQDESL